ncbi:MAG: hypothetical protein ACJ75B_05200 [Flavisolibacter sp.]
MRKYFLSILFLLQITLAWSQPIPLRSIEDSVLGWIKIYHLKGVREPKKVDDKFYTAAQLSICDSFANWMQASYMPKGGLGDVRKNVSAKLGPYNKITAALPQAYGATALIYTDLKYNSSGKMVPATNFGEFWTIYANAVPGWAVLDISTPSAYYFTMPSFDSHFGDEQTRKIHDKSQIETLKSYITFWVKDIEAGGGTDYVLLCKDNKSPFVKLTKGEYLQLLEEAIPRSYEEEKRKIYEANKDKQRSIDYLMKSLDEKKERFVTGLKKNREKYRSRLNEPATTSIQPSLYDLEFEKDVFSNDGLSNPESTSGRVPVYKIDPVMADLCKKDKPQWILMSWWWAPNDAVEKYMHESITNNFNFDYVYNFFFDPEKLKGQLYQPLRSPRYKDAVVITAASDAARKNAADANIHFYEDFSTTGMGKKPVGWQTQLAHDGSSSIVTNLDGLDGKWVLMNGDYTISPNQLKKPLPQNFTLVYELVAAQNFTWGAKGLVLQLSKETTPGNPESYLRLKLRPGYDGKDGEAVLETKFSSGYSSGTKWLGAPGFSNNKKNNHITVMIKKAGETPLVFIDKNKIAEFEKAIPAADLFNTLSFSSGSDGENNKYYISNIKVTKDQP